MTENSRKGLDGQFPMASRHVRDLWQKPVEHIHPGRLLNHVFSRVRKRLLTVGSNRLPIARKQSGKLLGTITSEGIAVKYWLEGVFKGFLAYGSRSARFIRQLDLVVPWIALEFAGIRPVQRVDDFGRFWSPFDLARCFPWEVMQILERFGA